MSVLSILKDLIDKEKVEKPNDFAFNRNRKVMATVLMPTVEEKKKEEVGLGELPDNLENNATPNK